MADALASLFDALADPTRRRVLASLAAEGSATATQLAGALPITRQAVAKHLQVLLDANVVAAQKRGRETMFAFRPGSLAPVARWVGEVDGPGAQEWQNQVSALQRHLEEQRERRGLAPAKGPLRAAARRSPPPG